MRKRGQVMILTKLTKLFKKSCEEIEGVSLSEGYKTAYLKSQLQASYPDMVLPDQHGRLLKNVSLNVKCISQPAIPPSVTEFIKCGCKTGCSGKRCTCFRNKLQCTRLCSCDGCGIDTDSDGSDSEFYFEESVSIDSA